MFNRCHERILSGAEWQSGRAARDNEANRHKSKAIGDKAKVSQDQGQVAQLINLPEKVA